MSFIDKYYDENPFPVFYNQNRKNIRDEMNLAVQLQVKFLPSILLFFFHSSRVTVSLTLFADTCVCHRSLLLSGKESNNQILRYTLWIFKWFSTSRQQKKNNFVSHPNISSAHLHIYYWNRCRINKATPNNIFHDIPIKLYFFL